MSAVKILVLFVPIMVFAILTELNGTDALSKLMDEDILKIP